MPTTCLETAGQLQGENELAATALAYMAEVMRDNMTFETAVGLTADAFGDEYAEVIFREILNNYNLD